uniref:Chromosome 21 open reading frame 140 n=1 Tax=Latimeria chalumnae TaxID=7897 RepID=H3B2I2_LATCH
IKLFTSPLLKTIFYSSSANTRKQCVDYLRTLRSLQFDGFYTVYLDETRISERLIIGGNLPQKTILEPQSWTLIHAGGSHGWVPWEHSLTFKYDCQLKEPTTHQLDLFQKLCVVLNKSYGKCVVVVRPKNWTASDASHFKLQKEFNQSGPHPSSLVYLSSTVCCPQVAKASGHELLCLPSQCRHLNPFDTVWSILKLFIINNRKSFTLMTPRTNASYQYILLMDLIEKGLERVPPPKWNELISKVHRWENYYLSQF